MGATTCKNCGTNFAGNFCPNCGQKATVGRITLRKSIKEAADNFFNLNRGLLPTVRDLLIRPGSMLSGYLDGKRKRYLHPVRMILAVLAVSYLIFFVLIPDGWMMQVQTSTDDPEAAAFAQKFGEFFSDQMSKNYTLYTLSSLPFLAIWYRIFFRKNGYNSGEYITVLTYVTGIVTILPAPFLPLIYAGVFSTTQYLYLNLAITLGYSVYALTAWLRPKRKLWGLIKVTIAYLFGYISWILVFATAMFFVGLKQGVYSLEDFAPKQTIPAVDSVGMGDTTRLQLDSLPAEGH
ncbi:MAG: DUF3667 domain-containing protein [Bacteroidota bacterium]